MTDDVVSGLSLTFEHSQTEGFSNTLSAEAMGTVRCHPAFAALWRNCTSLTYGSDVKLGNLKEEYAAHRYTNDIHLKPRQDREYFIHPNPSLPFLMSRTMDTGFTELSRTLR